MCTASRLIKSSLSAWTSTWGWWASGTQSGRRIRRIECIWWAVGGGRWGMLILLVCVPLFSSLFFPFFLLPVFEFDGDDYGKDANRIMKSPHLGIPALHRPTLLSLLSQLPPLQRPLFLLQTARSPPFQAPHLPNARILFLAYHAPAPTRRYFRVALLHFTPG